MNNKSVDGAVPSSANEKNVMVLHINALLQHIINSNMYDPFAPLQGL